MSSLLDPFPTVNLFVVQLQVFCLHVGSAVVRGLRRCRSFKSPGVHIILVLAGDIFFLRYGLYIYGDPLLTG